MDPNKPTRARFVVLAYLCALTFVLYIDRVCFAQAESDIRRELDITETQMSYVMMAFTVAYGLFEVPTGHWGDRLGARGVLVRIAVWWSIFTALTGACTTFALLLVVRFLFGAGEAGALPNTARVVHRWFPVGERGRVQGLIQTAMLLGGASAPIVAAYLIAAVEWRWAFFVFGFTGVVWAVAFWFWFRDDPSRHPAVNAAELAVIGPVSAAGQTHHEPIPWKAALSNPSIWMLGFIMACGAFNSYVYFSWFPSYLKQGRAVSDQEAGWLSSLVLAGAASGSLAGGVLADAFIRRSANANRARRRLGFAAYTMAATALWAGMQCDSPRWTAAFAALSCMATTSTLSTWWSCAAEVSGRHVGALFGLMNGLGGFGALGSQYFFGAFVQWRREHGYTGRDRWDPGFSVVMGVLLLAAVLWACYRSRPVLPEKEDNHAAPDA